MQKLQLDDGLNSDNVDEGSLFQSQAHLEKEISMLRHGDLYVVGKLWIQALRTVLVGANLSLIPVVKAQAKKKDGVPERPPKMKFEDLPIYESPHYDYKDYVEDQKKCPGSDVKILQTYLLPKVASWRKGWVDSISEFIKDAGELKDDACGFLRKQIKDFLSYMKCPDNLVLRQAVLATGAATGYYVGRGGTHSKRLIFTTLGALSAGALCFPKETDELFREGSYRVGILAVTMFNSLCAMNVVYRERVPCSDDKIPPPPPQPEDKENKFEPKN